MRIAGFIRLWHTHRSVGGMQGHALNLYSGLAKLGHEVEVFTTFNPNKPSSEIENGVKVNYIPNCTPAVNTKEFHTNSAQTMWALHKRKPFDIIHSESDGAKGVLGGPVPVIATWHGVSYCGLRSKLIMALLNKDGIIPALQQNIVSLVNEFEYFKRFDGHIAISDQAYRDLNEVYGISKTKISKIYNGFDTAMFSMNKSKRDTIRQKYQIPENAIVLGVAGRLSYDKGHHLFAGLLPKVLDKYKNVYVMVIGEGEAAESYRKLKSSRILMVGPKPYDEMSSYYNSLDVFVNPTLRYLGLDMTIQEAALCGVPILASNVGSIYESIIKYEKSSECFTVNDINDFWSSLSRMIESNRPFQERQASQHSLEGFSLVKMCSEYLETFVMIKALYKK